MRHDHGQRWRGLLVATLCCHAQPMAGAAPPRTSLGFGDTETFMVEVSAEDGKLLRVQTPGGGIGEVPWEARCLDVKVDDRWLVGQDHAPVQLVSHRREDSTLVLTHRVGALEIVQQLILDYAKRRVARRFEITNRGKETVRIGGFWFTALGLDGGGEALYGLPRTYPPVRTTFAELAPGRKRNTGEKLAPVIVQLSPARSVAFMSDSRTDHVSAGVQEREGGVTVSQGFSVLGWLKPGATFTDIGTAYLQLVDGDYDAALHSLWGWMGDVGLTVPADRPDWFHEAVLYSFHPGGTIGSSFSDLGGFAAATERLLPRLPGMGINALWMLPVEDRAPYHPRDYYRFQEGLGTPAEFRALVRRAHDLGLHVLMDLVPHGGSNTNDRAKAHPEWLALDLDGNSLSYWCFDFNHPTWQQYIGQVASHYVGEYDVDGYRVDACSGSKIPNWSRDLPYQRASLAQLQGGLGMLGAIRRSVKSLKPAVGGILAETQGAPYATTSDAVYDFTFCNSIIHDWRKTPADVFVQRVRRWLEEQKLTDPKGTIHLRHVENHDTLRGQGWFGVGGMRTVAALMGWIHGMPLVYHNMEVGHEEALRRIYQVRKLLPELRWGDAHYEAVAASPPEVFAFLRKHEDNASLVAINFGTEPVRARLTWQPDRWVAEGQALGVYDAMAKQVVMQDAKRDSLRTLNVPLQPLGYTVLAVRPSAELSRLPRAEASPKWTPSKARLNTLCPHREFPCPVTDGERTLLEFHDLLLPAHLRPSDAAGHALGELPLTTGSVHVMPGPAGSRVLTETLLNDVPADVPLALVLRVPGAPRFEVTTIDGVLQGSLFPVSRDARGAYGSLYWRPQGTSVLFDSRLTPLSYRRARLTFLDDQGRQFHVVFEDESRAPAVVQLHDRYGDEEGLFVMLHWGEALARTEQFSFSIVDGALPGGWDRTSPERIGELSVGQVGPWWIIENQHYRLTLHRTGGVIRELIDKARPEAPVLSGGSFYTDRGLCATQNGRGQHTAAEHDVECATRLTRESGRVRLQFEGQFRGSQRFARTRPPLKYETEYVFDESGTFRHAWRWQSGRGLRGEDGFLAAMWVMDDWKSFRFLGTGGVLGEGDRGDGKRRSGETKLLPGAPQPKRVDILGARGPLLTVSDLATDGPAPLRNTFLHGRNFFLAWLDGSEETCATNTWYEATALFTVGDRPPAVIPAGSWRETQAQSPEGRNLVRDGSFDQSGGSNLVSYRTGEVVPWPAAETAWSVPSGGEFTTEASRDGTHCAKVVNKTSGYLLFRQPVSLDLTPGTRYRLSAWVKGENLVRGQDPWRTGSIRVAFATPNGMRYAEVAALLGTFDWKEVAGDLEVPEGASSASVEVGVNGGTGTMWIDEVSLTAR